MIRASQLTMVLDRLEICTQIEMTILLNETEKPNMYIMRARITQ